MNTSLANAVLAMADTPPSDIDPITGKGPEWGKAAPIGLLVILLMGIATFFLLRSMTRKIKGVPASFDPPDAASRSAMVVGDESQAATMDAVTERAQPVHERAGPEPGGTGQGR